MDFPFIIGIMLLERLGDEEVEIRTQYSSYVLNLCHQYLELC